MAPRGVAMWGSQQRVLAPCRPSNGGLVGTKKKYAEGSQCLPPPEGSQCLLQDDIASQTKDAMT